VNAVPTREEQDEQSEHTERTGSTARVLDVVGRHVELVLMVAFGALVLIAVGVALATRSSGPAPSAPAATASTRASSAQPAPSDPAAPPSPTPRPAAVPQGSPPAAANLTPRPAPAPQTAPPTAANTTPATPAPPPAATNPTPAAPAPATPAPTPKPATSHTVVAGDTLASIGLRYQVGFEQIATANAVADPRLIRPGQRLRIPERAANTIVITPGDTLTGLADRAGTTVQVLRALNPQITNPNRITAGGQLRLR
jgi:LysM repeat protein